MTIWQWLCKWGDVLVAFPWAGLCIAAAIVDHNWLGYLLAAVLLLGATIGIRLKLKS